MNQLPLDIFEPIRSHVSSLECGSFLMTLAQRVHQSKCMHKEWAMHYADDHGWCALILDKEGGTILPVADGVNFDPIIASDAVIEELKNDDLLARLSSVVNSSQFFRRDFEGAELAVALKYVDSAFHFGLSVMFDQTDEVGVVRICLSRTIFHLIEAKPSYGARMLLATALYGSHGWNIAREILHPAGLEDWPL
jgi:hypothetical protein